MKKLFTIFAGIAMFHIANAQTPQSIAADTSEQTPGQIFNHLKSYNDIKTPVLPVVMQLQQNAIENRSFKICLDSLQKDVQLDYNEFVQSYINQYTSSGRRADFSRILGLAKYYFPIYEKAFRDAGIPEEIKFLSIVESELNPNAISRVGATGPWQFMYATARNYGLNINNYVDERRDPIQASYAAAAYLKDAYQEFGDWLLAIASYNCGKGNVERAMEKAGAVDFWSIREYLPAETRGYVPAFIATAYIMNNYYKHGITPQACSMVLKTDTVLVNKFVSINNIARVLDLDANSLALLNPSYTKRIINGTTQAPRRMVIPQLEQSKFAALYSALNNESLTVPNAQPVYVQVPAERLPAPTPKLRTYHIVKKGESLADIADQYGVDMEDLRIWNNLRGNRTLPGQKLKVSAEQTISRADYRTSKDYASRSDLSGAVTSSLPN